MTWCTACNMNAENGCRHPCGTECCPHRPLRRETASPALDAPSAADTAGADLIERCHTGDHARDARAFLDEVRADTRTLSAEHAEARSILRQLLSDPCCDHLSAVTVGRARKLMGDG